MRPMLDDSGMRCASDWGNTRCRFIRTTAEIDAKKKQATKRQAFHRATPDAQERNLTGVREVADVTLIWLVRIEPDRKE